VKWPKVKGFGPSVPKKKKKKKSEAHAPHLSENGNEAVPHSLLPSNKKKGK
jgi:hypothetical protein